MKSLHVLGLTGLIASCAATHDHESSLRRPQGYAAVSPCSVGPADHPLVAVEAEKVRLSLPEGATRPTYDSDDWNHSWPMWHGSNWRVDFVFGNGGLTEFVKDARCCELDDSEMRRKVCIGHYNMRYSVMADISRIGSTHKSSSARVSIEPNGLTEADALAIIASMMTTWDQQ